MSALTGASPDHAVFLDELVRLRTDAALTPRALAERLGIEEDDVRRGEAGARRAGVVELQRWAVACGSTLEAFGRQLQARTLQ